MRIGFEEQMGMVAVLRRFDADLSEVPEEYQDDAQRLAALVPTLTPPKPGPERDASALTIDVDGKRYPISEWDVPKDLRGVLGYLRSQSRPVPFQ